MILRLYHSDDKQTRCRSVTFQVTENCCMACTYCYQNHKTNKKMEWETIWPFLDELLTDKNQLINTKTTTGLILDFIGGEPLLEITLIDKICTYIFNYMIIHHHPWLLKTRISICSNGLYYFTPEVQNFLNKFGYFCSLGFSIDGDKTLHDMCRKDLNGNGTYDRTMAAAIDYHNKTKKSLSTKMTLSPENIQYAANAIIDLIQRNFIDIYVNCVFEEGWTYSHGTILYNQFKKIADYVIDNDLYDKVFIRVFNRKLYQPTPSTETSNWCGGTADTNLAIDPTGKMFSCIRYMESSLNGHQKELAIGDIINGYLGKEEYKNNYDLMSSITRQSQSTEECLNCPISEGCGWCSAYNYEKFGTLNKRATFICPTHKAFSLVNVYYWNKLYKKLKINQIFPLNLLDKEIDKIISNEEKQFLYSLIRR